MSDQTHDAAAESRHATAGRAFEVVVRVAVGLALLAWCLYILSPFLHAVLWGVLLSIALFPTFRRASAALGGRDRTTAVLFGALGLAGVLLPTVLLSASVATGVQEVAGDFQAGKIEVPPPPADVADWPVVGKPLHELWAKASTNLAALAEPLAPHLQSVATWLLAFAGSLASAVFQALFAIVIAAAFLAHADWGRRFSTSLAARLAGSRGTDFAHIATVTVRGVARGILGVALIQSTLAGIGFAVIGIPGAGLWALVCLVLAVVQIPPALVIVPTIIYVFSVEPTVAASLYAVWSVLVMLSDNVLKPFLFGSEVETPALVLLIGSIGGMLASGVIGLFTGAVILALGYELLRAWLEGAAEMPAPGDTPDALIDGAAPA